MKDGYYWVKQENNTWEIGEICGDQIYFGRDIESVKDFEIGDYIETPDKYK